MNENKKLPDFYQQMAERRDRKNELLGQGWNDKNKTDNLNAGHFRQEYLDELEQTRKDHYNHTVNLSEGFQTWLNESIDYQEKARQEQAQRMREQMFPPKEIDPLSKEINAVMRGEGVETDYQFRCRMRDRLFPDAETKRRQDENESKRHPMDIAMREHLRDRDDLKRAQ